MKTIGYVEDNDAIRENYTECFSEAGINIPGASPSASRNSLRERGIKVRTWLIDDHYATAHKSCLDL